MEILKIGTGWPTPVAAVAEHAEAVGYDGLMIVDSQSRFGDPYVALTLAAQATTSLRLGTGVTNPVTRHPAVTAAAISTINAISGGRALLGVGRGDSALAHLGMAPVDVARFEAFLEQTQHYLRGEPVPFEHTSAESLGLGDRPATAELPWLPQDLPKVPLQVFASGPRVIAAAARHAERITFVVGAQPERVAWAIDVARSVSADVQLGAMVVCAPHPDIDVARGLAAGSVATHARFATMQGPPTGPVRDDDAAVYEGVRRSYDMKHHGELGTPQAAVLTEDFIDSTGIVGPVEACVRRVQELAELGLQHLLVNAPAFAQGDDAAASVQLLEREVLPALRDAFSPIA